MCSLRLLAAATVLGLSAGAMADSRYEMISYLDSPSGRYLELGDYERAIELALKGVRLNSAENRLVENTNLCVAYTLTSRYSKAQDVCHEALRAAASVDRSYSRTLSRGTSETAKARTNRGVLRAMSGDMSGAADDFRVATAMSGTSNAPRRNLEHLESTVEGRLAMIGGR